MFNFIVSTSHPDAKTKTEREHDELVWLWDQNPRGKVFILDGNGFLIAENIPLETAKRIVRLHNQAIENAA